MKWRKNSIIKPRSSERVSTAKKDKSIKKPKDYSYELGRWRNKYINKIETNVLHDPVIDY